MKRGLSTLEAIVAVTVMAVAILPLLMVQQQVVREQQRFHAAYVRATAQRNAMAVLREVNPMSALQGHVALSDNQSLDWTSVPLTEPVINAGYPTGDGRFEVVLYRMEARVEFGEGQQPLNFQIERLGWRTVGESPSDTLGRAPVR